VLLTAEGAVLLLIDLQQRLVPAIHDNETVVARAVRLAEAARLLDIPVYATEQYPAGLGPTVAPLAAYPQAVLSKTTFSAADAPGFSALLPLGDGEIVVAGCEAHVCVLQTVLGLVGSGRHVIVAADAIGSRDPADAAAAIARARQHGAEIVTSEMVLFEWLRDARHPKFRDVQKLLKLGIATGEGDNRVGSRVAERDAGPMPWIAPTVVRHDTPAVAGERQMLEAWLEFHRQTLLIKCSGLTADQLRQRTAPPSSLSLLGLVRHMTDVERGWFRRRVAGEDVDFLYSSEADPDGEFDHVDEADAEQDLAAYLREIELARQAAAGRNLDETFFNSRRNTDMCLRWVYVHMIEEYARHNGHADLLRERIDGATGY
jgi:nicotinamidase-related amidase/uncharacterized damage-inducible protein DinB